MRSLVTDNHGIGIANASGTTTCVNSTIAGNSGAGIAVEEGSVSAASCTIARNGGTGLDAGERRGDGAEHAASPPTRKAAPVRVRSTGYNLTDDPRCAFGADRRH